MDEVGGWVGRYVHAWMGEGEWRTRYGTVVWIRDKRGKDISFADINPNKWKPQ